MSGKRCAGMPEDHGCCRYSASTLALAQGVLRRNFRLEAILGSWVKQRMGRAVP